MFDAEISHDTFKDLNPVSAGFCNIRRNKVDCFGESWSLGLKSDMKDDSFQATRLVYNIDNAIEHLG
jgi:hypothetical protein